MKNFACAIFLFALIFFSETALFSCSPLRTAGGSEIGNPTSATVAGTVVYPGGGGYVAGADVRLRPKAFCKDTTQTALYKACASNANAMTDDKGRFVLDSVDTGNYSIEVNDGKSHAALIACSVESGDTVRTLPIDTARPTSQLSGTIMAAKNGDAVYVQIFGLDRVARADPVTGQFVVPDVPQGSYDLRILSSSPRYASFIENNVSVESGLGTSIGVVDLVSFGGWSHCRKLLLNTTATGAGITVNITQFPILVRLTYANFNFGEALADGADLRFTKSDGSFLPYEIEHWDGANNQAEVWFKADTIFGNDSTHYVNMYWGATAGSVTPLSNSAAVFDTANGFQGVWHLAEAGNTLATDATINGYNGTPFGMTAASSVSGVIGMAQKFDGSSSYIQMTGTAAGKLNFNENDFYSISAWVLADTLDFATDSSASRHDLTIVAKDNCQYSLKCFRTDFAFIQYKNAIGWESSISPAIVAIWKYVVGVCAGTRQYLYVDGICMADSVNFLETSSRARSMASDVTIGKTPPGTNNWSPYFFKGKIDEVRICNKALSADWIKLCYMNQRFDNKLIVGN
jgi:hypothetical protein